MIRGGLAEQVQLQASETEQGVFYLWEHRSPNLMHQRQAATHLSSRSAAPTPALHLLPQPFRPPHPRSHYVASVHGMGRASSCHDSTRGSTRDACGDISMHASPVATFSSVLMWWCGLREAKQWDGLLSTGYGIPCL